jgi:hypothetical protein
LFASANIIDLPLNPKVIVWIFQLFFLSEELIFYLINIANDLYFKG